MFVDKNDRSSQKPGFFIPCDRLSQFSLIDDLYEYSLNSSNIQKFDSC
ncbi:hypothetical protein QUA46_18565 [Microcoleus sp. MON2_D6]